MHAQAWRSCEAWRGSLERRNEARLRPVQGLTTEHPGAVQGFLARFCPFSGRPGYVATSTAPGERYDGENGAVQP